MLYILDNGHGGMVGARYMTRGKRSPEVIPGLGVHEGEFNRDIVKRVAGGLSNLFAPHNKVIDLVPGAQNVSITERAHLANVLNTRHKETCLISLHANAAREPGWSKGHGLAVFHYPGSEKGTKLAHFVQKSIISKTNINADRGVRPRRYSILAKTHMPAILVEHAFMTNKSDARLLASDKFRRQVASAYIEVILQVNSL